MLTSPLNPFPLSRCANHPFPISLAHLPHIMDKKKRSVVSNTSDSVYTSNRKGLPHLRYPQWTYITGKLPVRIEGKVVNEW